MQSILLLHGAIGSKEQLFPLGDVLGDTFEVHYLNLAGHGNTHFPEAEFSIPLFAQQVIDYLDAHSLSSIPVFGYSLGGYIALWMAKHFPERIQKVITLGTKLHWDEAVVAKETGMLDAEKIEAKAPAFARQLEERHGAANWKLLLKKTAELLASIGADNALHPEQMTQLLQPCLLMLGDRDKMVSAEETLAVFRKMPNAQMAMLPNTPHPLEMVDLYRLAHEIKRFMN